MADLSKFIQFEIIFLLGMLMLTIFFQFLTGRINTKYLLHDKKTMRLSPGRVQLLIFTFVGVIYYLIEAAKIQDFPELPPEYITLLAGSNLVYLGGKATSGFTALFKQNKISK